MLIAGIDEAGRGPLAGPVISAVVILNPKKRISGLTDSKLLTPGKRATLFDIIAEKAIVWAIGRAEVEEIDKLNILQATMLSMQRAVAKLSIFPEKVLVDGNCCPVLAYPTEAIIDGDRIVPAISAASIMAKVTRDREMIEMDKLYPGFNFSQHKGYGTPEHLAALRKLGPTLIHRKSFSPLKEKLDSLKIEV